MNPIIVFPRLPEFLHVQKFLLFMIFAILLRLAVLMLAVAALATDQCATQSGRVVIYDATLVLAAIERRYQLGRFHPRVASNPLQNKTNGNVKRMMYADRRQQRLSV